MKNNWIKRILSAVLAAAVMVIPVQASAAFLDIEGHWAEEIIASWKSNQKIQGYLDGTFKPDNYVSRAEFITLINKTLRFSQAGDISFSDVLPGSWYYDAVSASVAQGYCKGFEDGTFRPDAPITRAEAAVMLARVKKLSNAESASQRFGDVLPAWAKGSIGAVAKAGYMSGYPDGTFGPAKQMTRAEAVVTLQRVTNEPEKHAAPRNKRRRRSSTPSTAVDGKDPSRDTNAPQDNKPMPPVTPKPENAGSPDPGHHETPPAGNDAANNESTGPSNSSSDNNTPPPGGNASPETPQSPPEDANSSDGRNPSDSRPHGSGNSNGSSDSASASSDPAVDHPRCVNVTVPVNIIWVTMHRNQDRITLTLTDPGHGFNDYDKTPASQLTDVFTIKESTDHLLRVPNDKIEPFTVTSFGSGPNGNYGVHIDFTYPVGFAETTSVRVTITKKAFKNEKILGGQICADSTKQQRHIVLKIHSSNFLISFEGGVFQFRLCLKLENGKKFVSGAGSMYDKMKLTSRAGPEPSWPIWRTLYTPETSTLCLFFKETESGRSFLQFLRDEGGIVVLTLDKDLFDPKNPSAVEPKDITIISPTSSAPHASVSVAS